MNNVVINPYEYFADPTKGRPIFNGSIYIGEPDTDPEVPANQKQVYARQENGTEVAIPQPVATNAGGYPTYNGSVIGIVVDGYYSIKVNDKNGVQALYCANRFSWDYSNPNDLLVTATGTTTPRSLADRFADTIHVSDGIGIIGDGITDDTVAVLEIDNDSSTTNNIDLDGLTVLVTELPSNKNFYNGFFLIDGFTLDAINTNGILSNATDTGGLEPAYTGGANGTPTVDGNSTKYERVLVGSTNCRSEFPRSGNYTSIYSWAYGNVSANVAARQSVAGSPQSVNTASEECEVYGFRGANVAAIFSEVIGSTGVNASTRLCSANATHSANIASNTSFVGGGRRARLEPVVSGGVVTSITIIDGGTGYDPVVDELRIVDRSSVHGVDAIATYTVDGSGAIDSITITNGGTDYVEDPTRTVAYVICEGENQANVATELSRVSKGSNSGNFATLGCETEGDLSACIASTSSNAIGGSRSLVLASTGSTATASGVVLSGNIVDCEHTDSVIMGRRVKTANNRSFVLGDAPSGSASTANRKIELTAAGNVNIAGTVSPSTVFTDYGEFFENLNNGTIPLGSIVAMENGKVKVAEGGDDILGVVSATACVRAGDSHTHWAKRYLLSEYGDYIYRDVEMVRYKTKRLVKLNSGYEIEVQDIKEAAASELETMPDDAEFFTERHPVENPDFQPEAENIPRSQRPDEWTLVGMIGQVFTNVSKDAKSDDFISADGSVSDTPTKLRVMKVTSEKDNFNIAKCLLQ